jgi:hypothetical protein
MIRATKRKTDFVHHASGIWNRYYFENLDCGAGEALIVIIQLINLTYTRALRNFLEEYLEALPVLAQY